MTVRTEPLAGAVELLERALGYTRVVLAEVDDAHLHLPTPCPDWDLGELLAHMEDALDAFTEAAGGRVDRGTPVLRGARPRVRRLQDKACALLGSWSGTPTGRRGVDVAGHLLDTELLVGAAALEITVHGWDVGRTLAASSEGPPVVPPAVPDALAEQLLALARVLVQPEDRLVRFGPALPVPPDAAVGTRLLAHLGRSVAS